ncbi:MAG TPA: oxidoreductase [Bdellovibrionales bacterium]|nr:oxidoreductase [Bdellovibrionales bacterium]
MNITNTVPRLGFLGVGWLGQLEAIASSNLAIISVLHDSSPELLSEAQAIAPDARIAFTSDDLLAADLDGVIVGPASLNHTFKAIEAIQNNIPVFCQNPFRMNAPETKILVSAAKKADCLLGFNFPFRHTHAMQCIRNLIAAGEIGNVSRVNLEFYSSNEVDEAWFYTPPHYGCDSVIKMGVHLLDLAFWTLHFPAVLSVSNESVTKSLHSPGFEAIAHIHLKNRIAVRLACSSSLPSGSKAIVSAAFHGEKGALCFRNINGSLYDFMTERRRGGSQEALVSPPDAWDGRAAVEWVSSLRVNRYFDQEAGKFVSLTETIAAIE